MGSFFEDLDDSYSSSREKSSSRARARGRLRANKLAKTKRNSRQYGLIQLVIALFAIAALGIAGFLLWNDSPPPPSLQLSLPKIPPQRISEGQALSIRFQGTSDPQSKDELVYHLLQGPPGASIDSAKGEFQWTPLEADGPGEYTVIVRATVAEASAECQFQIVVSEKNQPPLLAKIPDVNATAGRAVETRVNATDPDYPKVALTYTLEAGPPTSTVDSSTGSFHWIPESSATDRTFNVEICVSEDQPDGLATTGRFRIHVQPAIEVVSSTSSSQVSSLPAQPSPSPIPSLIPPDASSSQRETDEVQELLNLYDEKQSRSNDRKLFATLSYKSLRGWFARKFRREHLTQFEQAWGSESEAMLKWLDARLDFQEELFTAINPQVDDVVVALQLLQQLKEAFPKEIDRYGNLAIAICLVWDRPSGIYNYKRHADRAKAAMPADLTSSINCFRYLVEREKFMEGRVLYLPWEYLTLVVNHDTPLPERDWALQAYGPRRAMFGKCYHDCPYDQKMLDSDSEFAALNGRNYNFVTLRQFGGVCAHQADYASRIGKSIGVPAAYCAGEGRFGGIGHAWVMWVELKTVTESGIAFSLESYGRYRDDNYYVGTLQDPQSGQSITDRDLERRLHAVGVNAIGRRHAALAMQALPFVRNARTPDFKEQLAYVAQVLKLSPWNEDAWKELAMLAREQQDLTPVDRKQLQKALQKLFTVFASLPDFTVEVFGDLLVFEPKEKKRAEYYYQLLELYARAKRPDLSFKKLPDLVKLLLESNRKSDAVDTLALVIKQNANEGQYIPPVLDELEQLCANDEKLQASLLAFYNEFVPRINAKRGDAVSQYCIDMHQRAIQRFEAAGQAAAAQSIRQRLLLIQSSGKPSQ